MATASHIELSPATAGVYHVPVITDDSCRKASELLQKNHDDYHVYFNTDGFHNHLAHHLLAIFALGATPTELQHAFDVNASMQRPQYPVAKEVVQDMADKEKFQKYLGKEQHFHDYEVFFRKEMEAKGWQAVLNEHLFARDEHAERLLTRLYAGFYHPIIHLGYGIEFEQPAVVVEALAQAAIHDGWVAAFLLATEKLAQSRQSPSANLVDLLHEVRDHDKIRESPHWEDANKIRDGIFMRAKDEMMELASHWTVQPEELEHKTAEMINAAVYFAGGAQNPQKMVKFDFFYMHCVNASIFFSAFLQQPWLKVEDKCRLLEWKGRMDLVAYASRGSPELRMDEIHHHQAKHADEGWEGLMKRCDAMDDDGHVAKLVRALAHGEAVCKAYEGEGEAVFPIHGDMWLKLGHMVLDSTEGADSRWVRNAGFDKAWQNVPDRARL